MDCMKNNCPFRKNGISSLTHCDSAESCRDREDRTWIVSQTGKQERKNLAVRMDAVVFDRLTEYCRISRQSKTAVLDMAVAKFLDENFDRMKSFISETGGNV